MPSCAQGSVTHGSPRLYCAADCSVRLWRHVPTDDASGWRAALEVGSGQGLCIPGSYELTERLRAAEEGALERCARPRPFPSVYFFGTCPVLFGSTPLAR